MVPNGLALPCVVAPATVCPVRPVPAPMVRVPAESVPPTVRVPNSPDRLVVLLRTWASAFSATPQAQITARPNATLKVVLMVAPAWEGLCQNAALAVGKSLWAIDY